MTKQMRLAMTAATEYAKLVAQGRYPEADQVARTIRDLVGRYTTAGRFALPVAVRRAMQAR